MLSKSLPKSKITRSQMGKNPNFVVRLGVAVAVGVLLLLAYSLHPYSLRLNIGAAEDSEYVARFYPGENNPAFDYRWSRAQSYINVPNPGSPWELHFLAAAPRPDANAAPVQLKILANGREVWSNPLSSTPQEYTVRSNLLPFTPGDLAFEFRLDQTFSEGSNGRKDLGFVLDWVEISVVRNRFGLVIPPPFVFGWWLLLIALPLLVGRVAGLAPPLNRAVFAATALLILLLYLVPASSTFLHTDWLQVGLQIIIGQLVIIAGLVLWRKSPYRAKLRKLASPPLILFLGLVFLYLATMRGYFSYGDDLNMAAVTAALYDGKPAVPLNRYISLAPGEQYSKYGIGQSLAGLPFYAVASFAIQAMPFLPGGGVVERGAVTYILLLTNVFVTAGAALALYWCVRLLGYGRGAAFCAGALLGVATMAWHYSRTFLSEPLTMLCLILALAGHIAYANHGKRRYLGLAGFALGLAIATRSFNLAVLPPFALYLLISRVGLKFTRAHVRPIALAFGAWGLPIAAWLLLVGWYNSARFGAPLETGYSAELGSSQQGFTTPLFTGLFGLLFSSGKSIFLYNPVIILGLIGLRRFWLGNKAKTLLMASVIVIYLLLYSLWWAWDGGGVWGPRFLLPVVPYFLLWAAPLFEGFAVLVFKISTGKIISYQKLLRGINFRHWLAFAAISLLCLVSFGVQLLSIVVSYQIYTTRYTRDPDLYQKMLYSPLDSPIVEHLRLWLAQERPDFAPRVYHETPFARFVATFQSSAWLAFVIVGLIGLLALFVRWRNSSRSVPAIVNEKVLL